MKKRYICFAALFAFIIYFSLDAGKINLQSEFTFPKPDPSKGWATGYNFEKGDYDYHSEHDGTKWKPGDPIKGPSAPRVKYSTRSTEEIVEEILLNMDLEDLLDYSR